MSEETNKLRSLEALNADEVDYSTLTEEALAALAQGDEPYLATSALFELAHRSSPRSQEVARALLTATDDEYLRAAALRVLFEKDRGAAIDYMDKVVADCHPYVLSAMIELMIEEQAAFGAHPNLVQSIAGRFERDPSIEVDEDRRQLFFEIFAPIGSRYRSK